MRALAIVGKYMHPFVGQRIVSAHAIVCGKPQIAVSILTHVVHVVVFYRVVVVCKMLEMSNVFRFDVAEQHAVVIGAHPHALSGLAQNVVNAVAGKRLRVVAVVFVCSYNPPRGNIDYADAVTVNTGKQCAVVKLFKCQNRQIGNAINRRHRVVCKVKY